MTLKSKEKTADRVIVISDSADCDLINTPDSADAFGENNYLMDISSEIYGVGYSKFIVINGFSESLINFISINEQTNSLQ